MPASFSSTDFTYDQLVASETVSRSGIMTSGAGVVKRGTIVGVASATGKYTKTDAASAIVAEDCDATSADAACVVYVQGKFLATGITWPAAGAHSVHTALLHDLGVYILSAIDESGQLVKPDSATVGPAPKLAEAPPEQPPATPPVAVTLSPTSEPAGNKNGETGDTIAVTTTATDPWTAATTDPWITITAPTGPTTGNGTVTYNLAANTTGVSRSGSITIGDQTFAVTQAG